MVFKFYVYSLCAYEGCVCTCRQRSGANLRHLLFSPPCLVETDSLTKPRAHGWLEKVDQQALRIPLSASSAPGLLRHLPSQSKHGLDMIRTKHYTLMCSSIYSVASVVLVFFFLLDDGHLICDFCCQYLFPKVSPHTAQSPVSLPQSSKS